MGRENSILRYWKSFLNRLFFPYTRRILRNVFSFGNVSCRILSENQVCFLEEVLMSFLLRFPIHRTFVLLSFLGCSDGAMKGSDFVDVESYCQTQITWMESCAVEQDIVENESCEEGILDVVAGCDGDTVEEYGNAYSDFYQCLQDFAYCPDGEDGSSMERCSQDFRTRIDELSLDCFDGDGGVVDNNPETLGVEPSSLSFEEPPIGGTELFLLDDSTKVVTPERTFLDSDVITISSNGVVWIGDTAFDDCCFGEELPIAIEEDVVAVTWGDLNPEAGGSVRWSIEEYEDRGRALEVVYEGVPLCCADAPPVTSWMRMWENDRSVEIHIVSVQSSYPITIGVQYSKEPNVLSVHNAQAVDITRSAWLYMPNEDE
jgi:hypothetical protein